MQWQTEQQARDTKTLASTTMSLTNSSASRTSILWGRVCRSWLKVWLVIMWCHVMPPCSDYPPAIEHVTISHWIGGIRVVQTYQIYIVDFVTHCEGVCICVSLFVHLPRCFYWYLMLSKIHLSIFNTTGDTFVCPHLNHIRHGKAFSNIYWSFLKSTPVQGTGVDLEDRYDPLHSSWVFYCLCCMSLSVPYLPPRRWWMKKSMF